MERSKRKLKVTKKSPAEKISQTHRDVKNILCIYCHKPVDSKNHFIFEQSGASKKLPETPEVCDSPICLSRLISSKVCKIEVDSDDDDVGFIGFSNEDGSTENWVNNFKKLHFNKTEL